MELLHGFLAAHDLEVLESLWGTVRGCWLQWEQPLTPLQAPALGSCCIGLLVLPNTEFPSSAHPVSSIGVWFCARKWCYP